VKAKGCEDLLHVLYTVSKSLEKVMLGMQKYFVLSCATMMLGLGMILRMEIYFEM
jgi:hypothetical protein